MADAERHRSRCTKQRQLLLPTTVNIHTSEKQATINDSVQAFMDAASPAALTEANRNDGTAWSRR